MLVWSEPGLTGIFHRVQAGCVLRPRMSCTLLEWTREIEGIGRQCTQSLETTRSIPRTFSRINGLDPWASVIWVSQSADGFSFVTRTFSHEILAG